MTNKENLKILINKFINFYLKIQSIIIYKKIKLFRNRFKSFKNVIIIKYKQYKNRNFKTIFKMITRINYLKQ